MKQNEGKKERKSLVFRFLNTVEQVGNRLPHPITMFAALALFIVLLSGILAAAGISAEGEVIDSTTMEVTTQSDGPRRSRIHADSYGNQFYGVCSAGRGSGDYAGRGLRRGQRILVGAAEEDGVGYAREAGNAHVSISRCHV